MAKVTWPKFGVRKKIKQVGRLDIPGGGQVVVENGYAYVGHIDPPYGTSILNVKDPKHPGSLRNLKCPRECTPTR